MSVVVEETSVQVVAENALHSVRGVEGLLQFISACTAYHSATPLSVIRYSIPPTPSSSRVSTPSCTSDFSRLARTARDSLTNEPGSHRFEVIADEENPDVFYLNEVYADVDAFNAHATGPYFAAFFAEVAPMPKVRRGS